MRRGTTPTITLTVTNEDNTPCDLTGTELFVTFQERGCNGYEITKTGEDVDAEVDDKATIVTVHLTQDETLSFHEGYTVRVQIRCKSQGGSAQATDIAEFPAEEILLEGEI